MDQIPDKVYFRIGEASDLVGVEAHVLRYWESEFNLQTTRTPSGQRRYRREDVEMFLRVRSLLHEQGFTIAGARKALAGEPEEASGVDADIAREVGLGDCAPVFPDRTGGFQRRSNFTRYVWHPLRTAAGIPKSVTFHDLRHTHASQLLAKNVHPRSCRSVLDTPTSR